MKLYTETEKNEMFFEDIKDCLTHNDMNTVIEKSAAHWAFPDPDSSLTKFQEVGIACHEAILDENQFNAKYARMPSAEDFPGAITSLKGMRDYLVKVGRKGFSNKPYDVLLQAIKEIGDSVVVMQEVQDIFSKNNSEKQAIAGKDFDRIVTMRKSIYADQEYSKLLSGGVAGLVYVGEIDVDGELCKVKATPDLVTNSGAIINYITATIAKPEKVNRDLNSDRISFQGNTAFPLLKAALEIDAFYEYYGQYPSEYILLYQEKSYPHVAQAFRLTDWHVEVGRKQYQEAIKHLQHCMQQNSYPAYGSGIIDLEVPEWSGLVGE
ncbi:hypothetical protein VPHK394_0055 [Vibrio phage K394]